jgi:hypothetical protein
VERRSVERTMSTRSAVARERRAIGQLGESILLPIYGTALLRARDRRTTSLALSSGCRATTRRGKKHMLAHIDRQL